MNSRPRDQAERDRFTSEWGVNLAVVANAGSGKTTAISRRLAEIALSHEGGELLRTTAVVAYTKKAAAQIGQRARSELMGLIEARGSGEPEPLARLDRAFFGTIHSFCILLARRHGSALGVHLNPTLIEDDHDEATWEEFIEQDPMEFRGLGPAQIDAFLRHAPLDDVFPLARRLSLRDARNLSRGPVPAVVPGPSSAALREILDAVAGRASPKLAGNKEAARVWFERFGAETGPLPIARPDGNAAGMEELYRRFYAPLKAWLAAAGAALAAELSLRYRDWRLERGIQTYADQVETAVSVLSDEGMLEQIRAEGWRVILDEAQDADPSQLQVLIEIARPPGAPMGTWPAQGGVGPRPGHFCMVGDAQQGIYSSRADIRNFEEHVEALGSRGSGERLTFDVTFRAPQRVVRLLNETLGGAFGRDRPYNFGLPPAEGAPPKFLQVDYEPLVAGPGNPEGGAWVLPVPAVASSGRKGAALRRLAHEARHVARLLAAGGPEAVGARDWGDICILAPRRLWLPVIRGEFAAAGVRTSLQMRRNRSGDNPVYAWMCGLLAVLCDPENRFEWAGVMREVFGVSDALIAAEMGAGLVRWDEPVTDAGPVRGACAVLEPFLLRVDAEGEPLERFATDLAAACGLAARARMADPDGGLEDELARLLAAAADLGSEGLGPRDWLKQLLGSLEAFRAAGRPAADAVNLITSHSAKGLEWPVVIPMGLWRTLVHVEDRGLRLVSAPGRAPRVVFDNDGVGADERESRKRGLSREAVRLLYVTLTRAKQALVIPWAREQPIEKGSFAEYWGLDPAALDPLPEPGPRRPRPAPEPGGADAVSGGAEGRAGAAPPPFPARVLPHELGGQRDLGRAARHESALDEVAPVRDGADPLEYGVWWHEMLEFVPWGGRDDAVAAHGASVLERAAGKAFQARGGEEWARLLASGPWRLMREPRWRALAEVGIFAPLDPQRWIDGVIDLVLHDPVGREVWIVDWKTNRRRDGEDDPALTARLAEEYQGQLEAYGACARGFFGGCTLRLWVYSTVAGDWAEVRPPE